MRVPTNLFRTICTLSCLGLSLFLCPTSSLIAQVSRVDFQTQVRPILKERCFACHGALKQEGGLRVDTATFVRKGGDSGSAVDPETPVDSEMLIRVSDPDESTRMPPEGKPLNEEEIKLLRAWIGQGASIPKDDHPESSPNDHWAFQPPRKLPFDGGEEEESTSLSNVGNRNPIDILLARVRTEKNIEATSRVAPKGLLLRRVYLDLIGVPPSRAQLEAFLADQRPDAYERVGRRFAQSTSIWRTLGEALDGCLALYGLVWAGRSTSQ